MSFFRAFAYPLRGVGFFLRHPPLWKYAAAAFLVNLVLLAGLIALFLAYRQDLVEAITPDRFPAWLKSVAGCLMTIIAAILSLFLFTILGNLIAGPFLDAMTERMLVLLGEPLPPARSLWRTLGRSVLNQALKLLIFAAIQLALLPLLPLGFVYPVVSAFVTILLLALEYLDYPLDARRLPVPARFAWVFRRVRLSMGFGSFLFLVLLVPFLGYLTLPLTVCGAVLLVHDVDSPGLMG